MVCADGRKIRVFNYLFWLKRRPFFFNLARIKGISLSDDVKKRQKKGMGPVRMRRWHHGCCRNRRKFGNLVIKTGKTGLFQCLSASGDTVAFVIVL